MMRTLWTLLLAVFAATFLVAAQTRIDLTTPETKPDVTGYAFNEVYLNLSSKQITINLIGSDGIGKTWSYNNSCTPVPPATACVGSFDRWMRVFAPQKLGAAVLVEMQRRGDLSAGKIQ